MDSISPGGIPDGLSVGLAPRASRLSPDLGEAVSKLAPTDLPNAELPQTFTLSEKKLRSRVFQVQGQGSSARCASSAREGAVLGFWGFVRLHGRAYKPRGFQTRAPTRDPKSLAPVTFTLSSTLPQDALPPEVWGALRHGFLGPSCEVWNGSNQEDIVSLFLNRNHTPY